MHMPSRKTMPAEVLFLELPDAQSASAYTMMLVPSLGSILWISHWYLVPAR